MLLRHVHLDREAEQELGEVVVQVAGDLEPLVLALLGHPVRERAEDLLAILQLRVGLLERLAAEEHLASEEEREDEDGNSEESQPL